MSSTTRRMPRRNGSRACPPGAPLRRLTSGRVRLPGRRSGRSGDAAGPSGVPRPRRAGATVREAGRACHEPDREPFGMTAGSDAMADLCEYGRRGVAGPSLSGPVPRDKPGKECDMALPVAFGPGGVPGIRFVSSGIGVVASVGPILRSPCPRRSRRTSSIPKKRAARVRQQDLTGDRPGPARVIPTRSCRAAST